MRKNEYFEERMSNVMSPRLKLNRRRTEPQRLENKKKVLSLKIKV